MLKGRNDLLKAIRRCLLLPYMYGLFNTLEFVFDFDTLYLMPYDFSHKIEKSHALNLSLLSTSDASTPLPKNPPLF